MNIRNTKVKSFALALALVLGLAPLTPALASISGSGDVNFKSSSRMNGFIKGEAKVNANLGIGVRAGDFCEYITENGDEWLNHVAGKFLIKDTKRMHRKNDTVEKRADRDARLERSRTKADERRADFYARLEAKADTPAEETAVDQYILKMNAAIQARRVAVDAAVTAHRNGVDAAIAAEGTDWTSAMNEFKAEAQAAVNKAKTDCANEVSDASVRATFAAAISASLNDFKADVGVSSELGAKLKALAETQKQALKSAKEAYKTASMQAHAELKAAFNS